MEVSLDKFSVEDKNLRLRAIGKDAKDRFDFEGGAPKTKEALKYGILGAFLPMASRRGRAFDVAVGKSYPLTFAESSERRSYEV